MFRLVNYVWWQQKAHRQGGLDAAAVGSALRCIHRGLLIGLAGPLVPAATQRLVQVDLAGQLRQAISDQCLLRAEQVALGVEEGQVAVDADAVTAFSQAVVVLVRLHQVTLRLQLLFEGLARRQAIGDFLEGGLDGLFVFGDADVFLQLRVIQAGAQTAGVEDRQVDLRLERPGPGAALEQPGQVAACLLYTSDAADA